MKGFLYILIVLGVVGCGRVSSEGSQSYVMRDIKSFGAKGDGKTDDHAAFKMAAIFFNNRNGHGKLVISAGTYIVGSQIAKGTANGYIGEDVLKFYKVSDFIIEGNGKHLIKMKNNLRIGSFNRNSGKPFNSTSSVFADADFLALPGTIISFIESTRITIKNLKLNGNSGEMITGGKFGDTGFQVAAEGIFIKNTTDLNVENVDVSYCGRDGIFILNETKDNYRTADQKIVITNSIFQYNARQGLSWAAGVGLVAENCDFSHTGKGKFFSAPGAGVDIEAESGIITKGAFINCTFVNNIGCGLVADSGPSSNCIFTNCTFWGVTNWSVWVDKPAFKFFNCNIYGSQVLSYDAPNDQDRTVFKNCNFEDKPYKGKSVFGTFLSEINFRRRVLFEECTFTTRSKKLIWNEGRSEWKSEEMPFYKNCIFNIYDIPFKSPDWYTKTHKVKYEGAVYNFYIKKEDKGKFGAAYGVNEYKNIDKINWIVL